MGPGDWIAVVLTSGIVGAIGGEVTSRREAKNVNERLELVEKPLAEFTMAEPERKKAAEDAAKEAAREEAEKARVLDFLHSADQFSTACYSIGRGTLAGLAGAGAPSDVEKAVWIAEVNQMISAVGRFRRQISVLGPDWAADLSKRSLEACRLAQQALKVYEFRKDEPTYVAFEDRIFELADLLDEFETAAQEHFRIKPSSSGSREEGLKAGLDAPVDPTEA